MTWPTAKGSGDKTGVGDMAYGGGNASKNTMREYLQGGYLWIWSNAGASCVNCGGWLGDGNWYFLAADCLYLIYLCYFALSFATEVVARMAPQLMRHLSLAENCSQKDGVSREVENSV